MLAMDALNRGDVEAALKLTDPEVIFEPLRSPVSGAYAGHDGMRRFFADTAETFDRFRIELSEVREIDEDRVLAVGTMHARVRLGGVETNATTAGIATVRGGLMVAWKDFGDREQALKAAGLSG